MKTITIKCIRLVRLCGKPRVHVLFEPGPAEDFESVAPCGVKPSPFGGYFWMPADEGAVVTCPKCKSVGREAHAQPGARCGLSPSTR